MTTIDLDREALEEAIKQARADNPAQFESRLKEEERLSVARACVYSCQMSTLNLSPWQYPPCWINDPDEILAYRPTSYQHSEYEAAQLLKEMLAAGVSKYDPDPIAALQNRKPR